MIGARSLRLVCVALASLSFAGCADFDESAYCGPDMPQSHLCYLSVTSIEPTEGPVSGGTEVTILGSGFIEGMYVRIGGPVDVISVEPTKLVVRTRPWPNSGPATVRVGDNALMPLSLVGAFTFVE